MRSSESASHCAVLTRFALVMSPAAKGALIVAILHQRHGDRCRFPRYSSSSIQCLEFLPRPAQRNAAPPEIRPGVPELVQTVEHAPDRHLIRPKILSPEFVPVEWNRYRSATAGPHGVSRSHRLRVGVPVRVHKHAAAAHALPLLQCPLPGLLTHYDPCQLPRKGAHRIKTLAAFERHGHVETA